MVSIVFPLNLNVFGFTMSVLSERCRVSVLLSYVLLHVHCALYLQILSDKLIVLCDLVYSINDLSTLGL